MKTEPNTNPAELAAPACYAAGALMHEESANCRVKLIEPSFIKGWWTVREVDKRGRARGSEWECPKSNLRPLRHSAEVRHGAKDADLD